MAAVVVLSHFIVLGSILMTGAHCAFRCEVAMMAETEQRCHSLPMHNDLIVYG